MEERRWRTIALKSGRFAVTKLNTEEWNADSQKAAFNAPVVFNSEAMGSEQVARIWADKVRDFLDGVESSAIAVAKMTS